MRFLPVNSRAMLIELDHLKQTMDLFNALVQSRPQGVMEIIPAAKTLMLCFDDYETSAPKLAAELHKLRPVGNDVQSAESLMIPVHYDGEDLEWTANYLGMNSQELIEWHTSQTYQVAFMGFAPGFGYLVPLDENKIQIPRRKSPRKSIPAGAVALAGEFSGVYPQASPGGWQLIGQTQLKMWDLQRDNPALLQPGTLVKFEMANAESDGLSEAGVESQQTMVQGGDSRRYAGGIKVLQTGLPVFFQDGGRFGFSHLAITASGAADKSAMWLANRIVGNPRDTTVLEISQGSFRFQALESMIVAIAGAECDITLHTEKNRSYACETLKPIRLEAGDELHLGSVQRGYRNYLAVRGGFDVPEILGSSSCDSLANLGPAPVQGGQHIPLRKKYTGANRNPVLSNAVSPFDLPNRAEVCVLDVTLGPRTDWFTKESINDLLEQEWTISVTSNRIGLRLAGEKSLQRLDDQELASEATLAGAIQVPANGQPVLFHRDHPLTGGYPVIACVCPYHLDLAAQLPPGSRIKFNCVGGEFREIVAV